MSTLMSKHSSNYQPTAAELSILQILWKKGPSSVREIHEVLSEDKDSGYTTTLKIMQLMYEKGLLSRESHGRKHIYKAEIEQETTQGNMLDNFMQKTFGGSAAKLVLQALGRGKTSKSELDEIQELLDQMKKDQHDESNS